MTEPSADKKDFVEELKNRKRMGDKKFHSETSLQKYAEEDIGTNDEYPQDPGVHNLSVNNLSVIEEKERKRAMSQPGPNAGNMVTATANRSARRRPRIAYASNTNDSSDKQSKLSFSNRGDDSGTTTPNGNINRLYTSVNDLRGGTTPRKRSVVTMDAQSLRSVETHAPPPTSPEDNKKQTRKYLTLMSSCMYAILLVTLGLMIYLGDPFVDFSISAVKYDLAKS